MLFDTHAHYYDHAFDADQAEVLSALPQEGVGYVLCPGCDLWSSEESVRLAASYPFLFAAAGIHPENANNLPANWLERVEEIARHPKVKAIGEIGLDYYWKDCPVRYSSRCSVPSLPWRSG